MYTEGDSVVADLVLIILLLMLSRIWRCVDRVFRSVDSDVVVSPQKEIRLLLI